MSLDPEDYDVHRHLLVRPARLFGRLHHLLIAADNAFESVVRRQRGVGGEGRFRVTRPGATPFGRVSGPNPIGWWVSQREDDLTVLRARTLDAFNAVQPMLKAAQGLRMNLPRTYGDLIDRLARFATEHESGIAALLRYAEWLRSRSPLAPAMLFSYEVWGSTRRADRILDRRDLHGALVIDALTIVVFGLRDRFMLTRDRMSMRVAGELYEAGAEELPASIDEIVARHTAIEVFGEFTTYLTQVRDSLRAIDLAVEEQSGTNSLLFDDAFWRMVIEKARTVVLAEPQHYDLKERLGFWNVPSRPERERAKRKFLEHVGGLANTTGGVLIVGIEDASRAVVGISDLEDKLKLTRDVLDEALPDRELVTLRQVPMTTPGGDRACLIVVMKQSAYAIAFEEEGRWYCPVRRESGLARVPVEEIEKEKRAVHVSNYRFLLDLKTWGAS